MARSTEKVVLGLMSGTSLDGIDLALCKFFQNAEKTTFHLLDAETIPYPYYLKEQLDDALHLGASALHDLDLDLGSFYAHQINAFIERTGTRPELIASHGHTVLHQPDKGITLQIGNGSVMAKETGILVVNDFRHQDVSKGGQGAPLVPVGDQQLFGEYDFCLNLGGIANVSFDQDGRRIACDIVPCNMALNTITSWIQMEYDNNGAVAARGKVKPELLERLNRIDYYSIDPPKSLGKEWFLRKFLPEIKNTEMTIEDALKTVSVHIADMVAGFINRFASSESVVLTTGGGVYNIHLLELIRERCVAELIVPEEKIVNFKEALVFAYLGLLKLNNRINVLASVTGAESDTSAGLIHHPKL